jgi:hypothetical protein
VYRGLAGYVIGFVPLIGPSCTWDSQQRGQNRRGEQKNENSVVHNTPPEHLLIKRYVIETAKFHPYRINASFSLTAVRHCIQESKSPAIEFNA